MWNIYSFYLDINVPDTFLDDNFLYLLFDETLRNITQEVSSYVLTSSEYVDHLINKY